jgi:2,4-dienoyl-CoA reductase-like NADH-dependent reductase (Old Yellow Enzyme family)
MAKLFSVFHLRTIAFKNRIFVSPMCQYSSTDGMPNDWHLVHLGSRAVGGAALVIVEATAVSPEGRISPWDSGIWSDAQAEAFERVTAFIKAQGAVAGIQLAHAGRKASTDVPWRGGGPIGEENGGWRPLAPSAVPFDGGSPVPRAMTGEEIEAVATQFAAATKRSLEAGFEVVELHMAHGYLLHEFLSPLSNLREDRWGVSTEGRRRLPLKVVEAVRNVWPEHLPLFVRISCTDWVSGGWDLNHSIELCRHLKELGVDLIDCSSGGLVPDAVIPAGPGYQTPFAAAIRREVGIPTGAVGCITEPVQAEQIVSTGQADAVVMARELLRDPYWPLHAAMSLDVDLAWPPQYRRAKPTR